MSDLEPIEPKWIRKAREIIDQLVASKDTNEKAMLHQKLFDQVDPKRRRELEAAAMPSGDD